jgi:hypothetical protein
MAICYKLPKQSVKPYLWFIRKKNKIMLSYVESPNDNITVSDGLYPDKLYWHLVEDANRLGYKGVRLFGYNNLNEHGTFPYHEAELFD